jgi:hypothetical protein
VHVAAGEREALERVRLPPFPKFSEPCPGVRSGVMSWAVGVRRGIQPTRWGGHALPG